MAFRDDMNALYARAETLERDLERAQAELAELRGQGSPQSRAERERQGLPSSTSYGGGGQASLEPAPAAPMALEFLERLHTRHEPPQLAALHDYEDAIGRAVELVVPEMTARHRGVAGDGSHAELLTLLEFLVALWRDHTSGRPKTHEVPWLIVDRVIQGWPAHNELGRVLRQMRQYDQRVQGR